MRNYFSKSEGPPSILEKIPPLKVTGYFRAHPENGRNFFHSFLTYVCIQNLRSAKNTFKNDQPGPQQKKTLSRIWRHHRQLEVELKELLVDEGAELNTIASINID